MPIGLKRTVTPQREMTSFSHKLVNWNFMSNLCFVSRCSQDIRCFASYNRKNDENQLLLKHREKL